MNKIYFFLCFCIIFQFKGQDSLAKYSNKDLHNKIISAAESDKEPSLWKVYLTELLRKKPTDSLRADVFYNLGWELYRHHNYSLDLSIDMFHQGLNSAKKANSKSLTLYCLESLSTFYALKNDNDNSLRSLEEMKNISRTISDKSPLYVTFQASTARVYSIIGDFERSISIVKKSNIDIEKYIIKHPKLPKDSLDEFLWLKEGNYIHLAQSYNFQKKLDSASYCIKKAKELERKRSNKKFQNNIWVQEAFNLILFKKYDQAIYTINEADRSGYIDSKNKEYRSLYYLARAFYGKKEYSKSLYFCEKAMTVDVKIASFMNFELEVYNLASLNAEKLNDSGKEIYYSKKYNEISNQYNYAEKSRFFSKLYSQDVSEVNEQLKSVETDKNNFIFLLIIVILICIYLFWHYLKIKKDRQKFQTVILAFENKELENIENDYEKQAEISEIPNSDKKQTTISPEVEDRITKQLDRFEKKERFLLPNISLSSMAADFNTNSAYISAIIKKNNDKNFNSYINDLRIDYIINKLRSSPEYLNYKIAYLAEECGFSSHTVFIRIFTEKTGLTPSKFINFLKTE